MKMKNKNLTSLEEFKEKNYGKRGTKEREELERQRTEARAMIAGEAEKMAEKISSNILKV